MLRLLLLEDSQVVSRSIERLLQETFPEVTVISAGNIAQAQKVLEDDAVDMMMIDINLPDGNGIDFLCDAKTVYPLMPAIIVTAEPLPAYRLKAEEIGVIQFLEKPVTQTSLRVAMRKAFDSGAKTAMLTREESGRLVSYIPILDVVQLKCLARKTCQLTLSRGDSLGHIFLQEGRVVHAEANGRTGQAALQELMTWPPAPIRETGGVTPPAYTIKEDWSTVVASLVMFSPRRDGLLPNILR